nr:CDP-glycerol glycerophosphotransferase family protein [Lachnospiraceae bacterium]
KLNTIVHKCYTHVPVSSEHSGLHCAESFGLPEDVFKPIGVPRTDVFFDEEYKNKITSQLRSEYPILNERKRILLYAPTFRGVNAKSAHFPFDQLDLEEWGAFLKERNDMLLIKMHPFIKKKVEIPEEYKDYMMDMSDYREVNDILFVTDILITDYSSVMYEFSLLRRPMYFYAFDQRMYEMQRDFYESFEDTVPGNIYHTFPKLLDALRKDDYDYDQLDAFIKKNFKYTDGNSTDRFIDQILLED